MLTLFPVRLQWHLASTDWSLALLPGLHEGTYSIHPHQMRVRKPRNITDEDLATRSDDFERPLSEPSLMAYYIHRIRLAEVSRDVADAFWEMNAGHSPCDIQYDRIIAIDDKFASLLRNLPDCLRVEDGQDKDSVSENLLAQRYFANLSIQARYVNSVLLGSNFAVCGRRQWRLTKDYTDCAACRRCKLHLPFLVHVADDEKYRFSREHCLCAARSVLSLRDIIQTEQTPPPTKPLRIFGALYHFFCAVMVLTMDVCFNQSSAADEELRKDEIKSACAVLEVARGRSAAAGRYLDSLTTLLHKHYSLSDGDGVLVASAKRQEPRDNDELTESYAPSTGKEIVQDANFGTFWLGYLDLSANVDTMDWDALFRDLDANPPN